MTKGQKTGIKHTKSTPVVMDFLRETYLEAQAHNRVVLRELADRLGVSAPAVSRMAQRLIRKGLMHREGACGLALSENGVKIALKALRHQRIFEVLLVQKLGYTWDEVFPISKSAYCHLDDELIERMAAQLNHPSRCPHGDPIPTHDGKIHLMPATRLNELEPNYHGIVGRVDSHDPEMLKYLTSLGLSPGASVTMLGRAPFSGPIRVKTKPFHSTFENEQVIGAELASHIWVESLP